MYLLKGFKSRVQIEEALMQKEMPQFKLNKKGNEWYFEGWQSTETGNNRFKLRLILTQNYPEEPPKLYVISPQILWKHGNSGSINMEGVSHCFHTNSLSPDGFVQICHYTPETWDASMVCVSVFLKGILWLETYSIHLITGKTIDQILKTYKERRK